MAGIKVDAKCRSAIDSLQRLFGGVNIVSDFSRVNFKGEFDADFFKNIHDGVKASSEFAVACIDHFISGRREAVEQMREGAAGETIQDLDGKFRGRSCRVHEFLTGALADAFWIAIAPDAWRENALVPLVNNGITNRLPNQVIADCITLQAVFVPNVPTEFYIFIVGKHPVDFQVIAPAGQFEAVIAPRSGFLRNFVKGEVGPLSCK